MTPAEEDALIDKIFLDCQPDMIEAARLAIRAAYAQGREDAERYRAERGGLE